MTTLLFTVGPERGNNFCLLRKHNSSLLLDRERGRSSHSQMERFLKGNNVWNVTYLYRSVKTIKHPEQTHP